MSLRSIIFKEETSRYILNMTAASFWRVLLLGALAGAFTWALALAMDKYMLTPIFCSNSDKVALCTNSTIVAGNIAAIFVGIMTVPLMAMIHIKRALIVVAAAVIALWGVPVWVAGAWWVSLLWAIGAYAAVYATLAWINRLRGGIAAGLFIVLFVVAVRLVVLFA